MRFEEPRRLLVSEKKVRVVGVTRKELDKLHAEFKKSVEDESRRFLIFRSSSSNKPRPVKT